ALRRRLGPADLRGIARRSQHGPPHSRPEGVACWVDPQGNQPGRVRVEPKVGGPRPESGGPANRWPRASHHGQEYRGAALRTLVFGAFPDLVRSTTGPLRTKSKPM